MRRLAKNYRWLFLLFFFLFLSLFFIWVYFFVSLASYRPISSEPTKAIKHMIGMAIDSAFLTRSSLFASFEQILQQNSNALNLPYIELDISASDFAKVADPNFEQWINVKVRSNLIQSSLGFVDAKIKSRGGSIWHHSESSPSFKIDFSKSVPFFFSDDFHLIKVEDRTRLGNYASYEIGRQVGIISPLSKLVNVFRGGTLVGLYLLRTKFDEAMLRGNKFMPGALYKQKISKKIWRISDFEVSGVARDDKVDARLGKMVDILNPNHLAKNRLEIFDVFDKHETAKWLAFLNLIGGVHSDRRHNHTFFDNPTTGLIQPVLDDPMGFGSLLYPRGLDRIFHNPVPKWDTPVNERLSPLLNVALRDPTFVQIRNRYLDQFISEKFTEADLKTFLEATWSKIDSSVASDRHKTFIEATHSGWLPVPLTYWDYTASKLDTKKWIKKRINYLKQQFNNTSLYIYLNHENLQGTEISIFVDGNAGIEFDCSGLSKEQVKVGLGWQSNEFFECEKTVDLLPGVKENQDFEYKYLRGEGDYDYYLSPSPIEYRFLLSESVKLSRELIASLIRHPFNSMDHVSVVFVGKSGLDDLRVRSAQSVSSSLSTLSSIKNLPITIGPGKVSVTRDIVSLESQDLIIKPGTKLLLGEGVSIISKGNFYALASEASPIYVTQLDKGKNWGVIGAVGSGCDDARISFVNAVGGGLAEIGNLRLSGMVSFRNCDNVVIEDSVFGNNQDGDDTLHVVNGNATLNNLTFEKCFGDCIDFDYVNGSANSISVHNAGNDGFDFMTSRVKLSAYSANGIGDKGISVGEGTRLSTQNANIHDAAIGLAIKDGSRVDANMLVVSRSKVGISMYPKNWRYGRTSEGFISGSRFKQNDLDVELMGQALLNIDSSFNQNKISIATEAQLNVR